MDSILTSVKKTLGIAEEDTHFDTDLMMHINSVLAVLAQLGIGPDQGFAIQGSDALWTDFLPDDARLGFVQSYVHLKVKLLFDPPLGSAVIESFTKLAGELEWRISVAADGGDIQNG